MLYRVNDDGLILYYTAIVRKIDRLNARIAELEEEIDQLTARWRQERQDDNRKERE